MWYLTKEKLPEDDKSVLVKFANGGYSVGFMHLDEWVFDTGHKFMKYPPIA